MALRLVSFDLSFIRPRYSCIVSSIAIRCTSSTWALTAEMKLNNKEVTMSSRFTMPEDSRNDINSSRAFLFEEYFAGVPMFFFVRKEKGRPRVQDRGDIAPLHSLLKKDRRRT